VKKRQRKSGINSAIGGLESNGNEKTEGNDFLLQL
jgi:hypothetical protein